MAEINIFHYRKADTAVHRLDPRAKFFVMILLSVAVINMPIFMLCALSALVTAVLVFLLIKTPGTGITAFIKEMKFFYILFAVIILAQGLGGDGEKTAGFISLPGIRAGLLYSWRLAVVVILGQMFALSTNFSDLQEGIYLLLKPFPFLTAGKIAGMVSLTIVFIPLIFDQYREVRAAWLSRLGSRNRNPLVRINTLALPLLETILGRADEIANAMESRCYSDQPAWTDLKIRAGDIITIIFCIAVLALSVIFS